MARRQVRDHSLITKLDAFSVVHDLIGLDWWKGEGIAKPKIAMPAAAEQWRVRFARHEFCARHLLELS